MPYAILGYRYPSGNYKPIEPNERQRIYSQQSQLWFGVNKAGDDFEIFDAAYGEPMTPALSTDQERVDQVQGELWGHDLAAALDF